MTDRSILDHRTISSALNDAFDRIRNTKLQIKMAVSGRDAPYTFKGSVNAKFYSNGLAVDLPEAFCIVPYTSILYVEVAE